MNPRSAYPEHHEIGFDICAKAQMPVHLALIMARGFARRGFSDMAEGCTHWALRVMCLPNPETEQAAGRR